ncbi:MAG TPA: TlpA disulfide reductase family protein [Steroidobacteraceae bacterium]|nr:TlpA disulfide reductase family protein [Steroidobacteraceae bacterium]
MKRTRAIPAAAVVVFVAAWSGVRLSGHRGVPVPAGESSAPTAADRVPIPAPPLPSVRIPQRVPPFTLTGLDGKPRSIAQFQGHSLIINFWATWCGPCRREIPLLQSIASAWRGRHFAVVGVAVDRRENVAKFARRFKIRYPLMSGEQDALAVATAFGVATPAFPFTVFSDERGRIVALYLGELHRPQIDLILGVVQALNANRIALPAARRAVATGLARLDSDTAAG